MDETATYFCDHCGEEIEASIDPSAGTQEYVEDCPVCCAPNLLTIRWDELGTATIEARAE